MIKLRNVKKIYVTEEKKVHALKGISLDMRKAELLCVLGHSGCGKTTLLNIIGGLDRYTSGDLIIDGKSTKRFTDEDWDTYRSRKVGFVFQSYNLISHQTVLENVETALIISGIGREERRKRAIDALVEVGLAEHLRKTPRQLSGGEMQRVAIARALVNNPQMILADEPTGALDSENSVKIMKLLKKISKDRLVVMVTHNAELAEEYATRIINMKDGEIVSDSAPYKAPKDEEVKEKGHKPSFMPYALATKLSVKNLSAKKVRTLLTSIASSIAIIGIALVLACSNGLNAFIDKIQADTMSSIPIAVSASDQDYTALIESVLGYVNSTVKGDGEKTDPDKVLINHTLKNLSLEPEDITNEITPELVDYISKIDTDKVRFDAVKNVNKKIYKRILIDAYGGVKKFINVIVPTSGSWTCLPPERDIVDAQYDLIAGKYPQNYDELLLVVDKNSSISDMVLASYFLDIYANAKDENEEYIKKWYTFEDILRPSTYGEYNGLNEYNLILNDYYYEQSDDVFTTENTVVSIDKHVSDFVRNVEPFVVKDKLKENGVTKELYDTIKCYNIDPSLEDKNCVRLKIVGILKLNDETQYGMLSSPIAYTSSLNDKIIELERESAVVKAQIKSDSKNVVKGAKVTEFTDKASFNNALSALGYAELPTVIKFYPKTIKDKDYLIDYLENYEEDIKYTDKVGIIIDIVRSVVGGVSAILIALTSVSLIVSAIMIGIITYVSVIERTKEIGILRSVGARKKDVVRLFVTETGMIGLVAGVLGVILTVILRLPLNAIMTNVTGISGFVFLKWWNYIVIILGSAVLTVVAGLIPSLLASKKDPVKALRSE